MANTTIQLKWSDVTSAPTSLNVGEPAYSNTSQKFFIGDTANNVLTIGGKFYVDQQGLIFTKTNVAFDTANSAASYANAAFATANSGSAAASAASYANGAFLAANSASSYANAAFATANTVTSASSYANSGFAVANSAGSYANSGFSLANGHSAIANSAQAYANSAFLAANTPSYVANSAASYANSGFAVANAASSYANSAYTRANNSINANTGGTIAADLVVTGNLTVQGQTTFVNTQTITAQDSLIRLANNNTVGDTVDIGFYGAYNSGGVKYAGLVRQAAANFFLFKDLNTDPTANVLASGSLTAANTGTLTANITAYSVSINGVDTETRIGGAYTQANTGVTNAAAASSYANSAFLSANTPSYTANSAASYANSAFGLGNSAFAVSNSAASYANSGFAVANSAGSYANSAFLSANTPSNVANSAASYANSGFAVANAASSYANSAFAKANTDFTNISISSTDYGSASIVPTFHVAANGRIDAITNVSIAIAASAITSGTLAVARGGSGAGSFTTNAVLLGNGTSAFNSASSSTEGHLLTINASGVPTFAHLQGGTF